MADNCFWHAASIRLTRTNAFTGEKIRETIIEPEWTLNRCKERTNDEVSEKCGRKGIEVLFSYQVKSKLLASGSGMANKTKILIEACQAARQRGKRYRCTIKNHLLGHGRLFFIARHEWTFFLIAFFRKSWSSHKHSVIPNSLLYLTHLH